MSGRLRRAALGLALAALIAACAACGGADQEQLRTQKVPRADVTVAIVDSPESVGTFQPHTVRISPGQTVGWINAGGDYHTVTFDRPGAPPSSHGFGHAATFRARFPHAGTFTYRCLYHDGMTGEVIVGAGGPTPGARSTSVRSLRGSTTTAVAAQNGMSSSPTVSNPRTSTLTVAREQQPEPW